MTLAQRFEERGRQQGMQQGKQQGEQAMLLRLLQHKFGQLPKAYRQKVETANLATLSQWSEIILNAQTLDEVFVA